MPTKTWQSLERFAASIFGTFRNPLSGANNRTDLGDKRRGDVLTKPGELWLVECKHKKRFAFHSLFRQAQLDDPKKTLFLFTHEHGQQYQDSLVTMKASVFAKIWPEVKELFNEQESQMGGTGDRPAP